MHSHTYNKKALKWRSAAILGAGKSWARQRKNTAAERKERKKQSQQQGKIGRKSLVKEEKQKEGKQTRKSA